MSNELNSGTAAIGGRALASKSVRSFGRTARLAAVGAAMMLAGASTATAAVGVIDTFDDADLSEYTLTKILDQGNGTSNISFSSPNGMLRVSSTSPNPTPPPGGTPEQVLFLRGDRPLGIGEQLVADVPGVTAPGANFDRDFGIAVGFTATPAGLANGATGDTRSNFLEISRRDRNAVNFFARNGAANVTANVFINEAEPLSLFIARTSADTFEAGFLQNGTRRVITGSGLTFASSVPGGAVGFYSDLRFAYEPAPVSLDNLRIEAIPEPSTLAVLAAGGLLALRRRRA